MSRRGWREPIEPGIYRSHRVACPSSADQRPGRRCACPYAIAVTGTSGRTVLRTVDGTLPLARRERARLRADAGTIRALSTSGGESLHDFARAYLRAKSAVLRPATIEAYDRAYRTRIAPELGGFRLDQLTRELVELWLARLLEADPRRRSIEHAVETLAAMLATAVEWGRLPVNPAARLRVPTTVDRAAPARVLTREQLERLLGHAGSLRGETMLRAAAEAGLRRGEIIALRWADVLIEERRLLVRATVWQGSTGGRIVQPPKSGKARRVAITATLAGQLARLREEDAGGPDDHVWPGRDGRPMDKDSPGQLLERVQRRAGLVTDTGRPLVGFHGLRHTAASIGLAGGVPLIAVSRQLGHARVDITAKVYAHLLDDSQLDGFAAAHETVVDAGEPDTERGGQASLF
ncbi:MAG: tyrosine-type recombinase/integrase [Thermoleophilia bacterium]